MNEEMKKAIEAKREKKEGNREGTKTIGKYKNKNVFHIREYKINPYIKL